MPTLRERRHRRLARRLVAVRCALNRARRARSPTSRGDDLHPCRSEESCESIGSFPLAIREKSKPLRHLRRPSSAGLSEFGD
jgi:hypothetical protein